MELDRMRNEMRDQVKREREQRPRVVYRAKTLLNTPDEMPQAKFDHLLRLTDDVGILQHALCTVPNREHGYCTDDNARALLRRGRVESAAGNLAHIAELTDRMARISTQLKVFARKTSGEAAPVPLGAALDDSLALLAPRIRETGTGIRRREQAGLVVRANRVQLEQVLVNLIGNALQAVEQAEERFIEIDGRRDGGQVVLTIRDSGPGIALDILNQIFDPFFTTKEEGRGLGLGLSISQRIVEVMRGTLEAGNHPDGGALFTLRLPAADASV